jgi:L-alanine-DL-glutamate epimerase-like enolase superfamily enzyme
MKTNYHTHTTRCMHATGSDEDYVLSAIKGGYQELGFSDHTPWKYHTDYVADMRMLPEELPRYVESLRSLREKYRDQISIKIGLECEYFPAYIHWLKEKGIVMIEQPMPKEKLDDIAWITQQSPLPIFADESLQRLGDVAALKDAFTGINIKLMKCTGMREAWKMVTLAHALGMRAMVGCMTETSCAISAASQFSPLVDFADLDGNLLISNDRFKGVEVVKGKITLNDLPGIGVMKI